MGYLSNKHIHAFVSGKTVEGITTDENGHFCLVFKSGEWLRLLPIQERGDLRILATPFCSDGTVKQSTQIFHA